MRLFLKGVMAVAMLGTIVVDSLPVEKKEANVESDPKYSPSHGYSPEKGPVKRDALRDGLFPNNNERPGYGRNSDDFRNEERTTDRYGRNYFPEESNFRGEMQDDKRSEEGRFEGKEFSGEGVGAPRRWPNEDRYSPNSGFSDRKYGNDAHHSRGYSEERTHDSKVLVKDHRETKEYELTRERDRYPDYPHQGPKHVSSDRPMVINVNGEGGRSRRGRFVHKIIIKPHCHCPPHCPPHQPPHQSPHQNHQKYPGIQPFVGSTQQEAQQRQVHHQQIPSPLYYV